MANVQLLLLVILSIVSTSLQDTNNNDIDEGEANPYAEAASSILKEQNAQNIGGIVSNFLQSGGAAQLGNILSKIGNENAGQLLQGLASLVGPSQKEKEEEGGKGDSTANLLQGLGTLMGALQGAGDGGGGGDTTGALLQGLGSLLGGQGGQGGLDPSVLGSVINMFAKSNIKATKKSKKEESSQPEKESSEPKNIKAKPKLKLKLGSKSKDGPSYDLTDLLSLAASFLGQGQGQGQGSGDAGNLLGYLPMILQTIGSFKGPQAEKRAESHAEHSGMLPPLLEKLHIAFDNFIHSEMGKYFINVIGAEKAFKVFEDDNGRFNYSKFAELMENLSFRRHWIRMVTDRIVDMLQHASDPKAQKMYIANARYFVNSFLKAQGVPKTAYFDPARPIETLSALVDYVSDKYLEIQVSSKEYVKQIVDYVQDLNSLAQKSGTFGDGGVSKELSNKLADTINLEIIEPVARVNRAYRFAKSVPSCDRYVFCTVNEENSNEVESLPRLKSLLYKGASLAAAWFLSDETGTSFWTLYTDIVETPNCKALYSDKCHDFHLEEIKVTTEYVHSEL